MAYFRANNSVVPHSVVSLHRMNWDNRIGTTELPETLGRNTRYWRERRVSMLEDIDTDRVQLCHSSPRGMYHTPSKVT